MAVKSHLDCIEEYYCAHGRLITAERVWLECAYMVATDSERPIGIPGMIRTLQGAKGGA